MATVVAMLTRRCAWCSRAWSVGGWAVAAAADPERETSTICPDCVAILQRLGTSR